MPTRLRDRPSASSSLKQWRRRTKVRPNIAFAEVALWLATKSNPAEEEPQLECTAVTSFDDASLSRDVWDADGGFAAIDFKINQIAKRLEEPSLGDALSMIASSSEKNNV